MTYCANDRSLDGPRCGVALFALGIMLLFGGGAHAQTAITIQPGYNFLATAPGSYTTIDIPQGFFGTKGGVPSDAIVQRRVALVGRPMGTLGLSPRSNIVVSAGDCHSKGGHYHCHEDSTDGSLVDTITRVSGTQLNEGGTATVSLQFVALALETPASAPLKVTYGGSNPSSFKMLLSLDPSQQQPVGSITLTRTAPRGGRMAVNLPVKFRAAFSAVGETSNRTLGPISLSTNLESTDNTFTLR